MNDIKEMKDEELEKVSGGFYSFENRSSFTAGNAYEDYKYNLGTWFCKRSVPEFI